MNFMCACSYVAAGRYVHVYKYFDSPYLVCGYAHTCTCTLNSGVSMSLVVVYKLTNCLSPCFIHVCIMCILIEDHFFQVKETNDSSIVSKLSASNAGYFVDENLKYFVTKPARRAPLINRYCVCKSC